MSEAVVPCLAYLVLQIVVMIVGLNIVRDKELNITVFIKTWIMGQMLLFTILQVVAVPMIMLKWQFSVLFWTYIGIVTVLFGFGLKRLGKSKISLAIDLKSFSWLSIVLIVLASLVILSQSCIYFFGVHLDEDDARWLAEANDALEYGHMMTVNFHTGEWMGQLVEIRDVTSPWPMLFAILSRFLNTRVSIVAHTVYPAVEVFLLYGIYYLIGTELLKKREARFAFLLLAALITFFYGGSVYTQGAFSLIRIWQGKASVAAVIVPCLLYLFICINKRDQTADWIYVVMTGTAACLMSAMGISIGLIMIAVYGFYHIVAYLKWKRMPLFILTIMPSIVFTLTYYYLKG